MLKILIVDDEILVRVGIKALLPWEEYGFKICAEASDGEEALEIYKTLRPDIVFTDIIMPKMDGLELIERIKEIDKNTRCVILTCLDEINYVKEAMFLGACGYFAKISLDINQVLELLNRLKADIMQEREKYTEFKPTQQLKNENRTNMDDKYVNQKHINYIKDTKKYAFDKDYDLFDCYFMIDILESMGIDDIEQFYRHLSGFIYDVMSRYSIENKLFYISENKYILGCIKQNIIESLFRSNVEISDLLAENISNYFNIDATVTFYNMNVTKAIEMIKKQSKGEKKDDFNQSYSKSSNKFNNRSGSKSSSEYTSKLTGFGSNSGISYEKNMKSILEKLSYAVKSADKANAINIINYIGQEENSYSGIESLKKNALEILFIYESILREYSETLDNFFECDFVSMVVNSNDTAGMKSILTSFTIKVIDIIINLKENRYRAEVEEVIKYINIHFNEKITLDYASNLINMNSSYFSRLFKEETGMGLIEYITKIRIEKAKEYLKKKDMKLNEIAELVGFEDANYFGRVFKKVTGFTPSKYREKFC
jgi:two-component system response regulator YesN